MKVRIMGRNYQWEYPRHIGEDVRGLCDPPTVARKTIQIKKSLSSEERLEVEIHEFTHAADWGKDEEWVTEFAADMARVLWRLGYRIPD